MHWIELLTILVVVSFCYGSADSKSCMPRDVHCGVHPAEDDNDGVNNNTEVTAIEEDNVSTDMLTSNPTMEEDESCEVGAGIEAIIMDLASGRTFQYVIVGLALALIIAITLLAGWCVLATRRRCCQQMGRSRSFELGELGIAGASGGSTYSLPPPRSTSPSHCAKKSKKNAPLPPPPTACELRQLLGQDGFYEVPLHSRHSSITSLPLPPQPSPPSSSSSSDVDV